MIKQSKPIKFSFREFKKIYSKVPRVTVEIVIISKNGVALSLRNIEPYKGYWHTPGGTILYGESIRNAVIRVAKEELGVNVKISKFLGFWEIPEWSQPKGFCQTIGLIFQVRFISGKFKSDEQSSEIKFFRKLPQKMIKEQKVILEKRLT